MLGTEITESEEQISDALGEICNMVAGNFESGSAQMKATSQATVDRIAKLLQQRDCSIRVEGHTDNIPIHNTQFSSNWELSAARATEIVRVLIVRDGYGPNRLSAAGYAEFHPIDSNATAQGRSMNRRVDIVILRQGPPATASIQLPHPSSLTVPHATNSGPAIPSTAIQSVTPPAAIAPKALPTSRVATAQ
jgi:hypothetical protein